MIQLIKSNQNKVIKYAKSLQKKKYRDLEGEYLIEGVKLINEAIANDISISALFFRNDIHTKKQIDDIINICLNKNIPAYGVDDKPFSDISETETSQGVIAIVKKKNYSMDLLFKKDSYNLVILEEVQDPGNVGTIIRTADAFGFDMVILSKGCADVYSGKTIRATMGSLFHIPVITDVELESIINKLNQEEVLTLATTPYEGTSCFDMEYKYKNAIIIGNESRGISDTLMKHVKLKVSIPMIGKAESLNASVAASLMMYEVMRYGIVEKQKHDYVNIF